MRILRILPRRPGTAMNTSPSVRSMPRKVVTRLTENPVQYLFPLRSPAGKEG